MIVELDNLPPDREWGILTREFSGKARGMALEVGILGRWLQKERIRTRLSLLYAGAEPDRYGREDRRLLWEDFMNREGLPDEATDAVLSIPSLDDTSEWLLISSPTINLDGIRPWRARTFQGLIDALRYGWAEIVSAAVEQGRHPMNIDSGAVILTVPYSNDTPLAGSEPQALPTFSAINGIPGLFNLQKAETDPIYEFGRIYNRLLKPPDPFSYLDILESDKQTTALKEWLTACSAAGYSDVIRRQAILSMEESCRLNVSERLPESSGISAPEIRQLSGSVSAPGRDVGVLWNPHSGHPNPKSNYIIVCDRWDSSLETYIDGSTGLVERNGGRGGPGAYVARIRGIPAVSEVRYAELLQSGANAEIDGGTGIVTLF